MSFYLRTTKGGGFLMNKSKLLVVIGALLSISFFISGCGKNSVLQPVVKSKPQGNTGGIPVLDTQTKLDSRDFEKSPEQYWTETGINLNDYAQWINNNDSQHGRKEGCYSEEKLTIACLYSLTYLADILDLALTFESNTNDEVVVRNGPLKVIKKQKELGDKKKVYKQVKGMAGTV